MSPEELERWIVPCAERLGAEPCDAMHFAADVRSRVEGMMDETIEACAKVLETHEAIQRADDEPENNGFHAGLSWGASAIRQRKGAR